MSNSKNKTIAIKSEGDSSYRERYLSWADENTKFMLQWYIDIRKDKAPTFKFKKQHHLQCANALNEKFVMGATQSQVDRHYRGYKEKYGWIRRAMNNSGNGFDATSCRFTISESEKAHLPKAIVNYLTKPTRFFDLLEEMFSDQSQADGSFAADHVTIKDVSSGEDDIECPKDLPGMDDNDGNESDTIARDSTVDVDDPSSTSSKKCKRAKSPPKKIGKEKCTRPSKISNDDIAASIKNLADSLASVAAPSYATLPAREDPRAQLWRRIDALTIKTRLKLLLTSPSPSKKLFVPI